VRTFLGRGKHEQFSKHRNTPIIRLAHRPICQTVVQLALSSCVLNRAAVGVSSTLGSHRKTITALGRTGLHDTIDKNRQRNLAECQIPHWNLCRVLIKEVEVKSLWRLAGMRQIFRDAFVHCRPMPYHLKSTNNKPRQPATTRHLPLKFTVNRGVTANHFCTSSSSEMIVPLAGDLFHRHIHHPLRLRWIAEIE